MADTPPVKYVAYPRKHLPDSYGSLEKLQALGDGYFGLNTLFVVNVVIGIITLASVAFGGLRTLLLCSAIVCVAAGFLSNPYNKKIAYGKEWPEWPANLASLLMGLNSFLCFGILGYGVMQQIALKEIRRYGVDCPGYLGLTKKRFNAALEKRKRSDKLDRIPNDYRPE